MTESEKNKLFESFNKRTHVLGRICNATTLVLLVGAPFVIGAYLGALPSLSAAARAFLAVGLVWMISGVVEYLIYTPMLGAGGSYLAFITGNLVNLKIPCAVTSRDIAGTKTGTAENEIVSTLSIATLYRFSRCSGLLCSSLPLSRWSRLCSAPWHISTSAATSA